VLVVMAVGAVCALAVAAAVINDLRQPAAQAPASIAAGNLQAKSAPGAATTVRTVWGTFAVPGTGFADASRVTAADRRVSVVPVWPEAWATNDSPTCALLHGGEVQLLEVADDRPGGRWFKVRRSECTGWVEDRFLSVASPRMPASSTATAPK
jgi:hypothetical protein